MRSLLVAPPDTKGLAEALASGADAVVVDLARASSEAKPAARAAAAQFLAEPRGKIGGPTLIVRVSALDSGETDLDLDTIMPAAPHVILLPRSLGRASVQQLSAKLAVREADLGLNDGVTRIIAVADLAQSLFGMSSYRGSTRRLVGIAWSADSLRNDMAAETERDRSGAYVGAFRLARDLTLLAAAAARVAAIDTAFADMRDAEALRAEALAARRDGFAGKMALDPAQAAVINDAFPAPSMRLAERSPS
jgi:citrate lyase subunit beta/citryl-CoA lyase